jgi:hypothetical protein
MLRRLFMAKLKTRLEALAAGDEIGGDLGDCGIGDIGGAVVAESACCCAFFFADFIMSWYVTGLWTASVPGAAVIGLCAIDDGVCVGVVVVVAFESSVSFAGPTGTAARFVWLCVACRFSAGRLRLRTRLMVRLNMAVGVLGVFGVSCSSAWAVGLSGFEANGSMFRKSGRGLWSRPVSLLLVRGGCWKEAVEMDEVDRRRVEDMGEADRECSALLSCRLRASRELGEMDLREGEMVTMDGRPTKIMETTLAVSSWLFLRLTGTGATTAAVVVAAVCSAGASES